MPLEVLTVKPVEDAPLTVHRAVSTADRSDSAFIDGFRSSKARGTPPRRGSPEERFRLIHEGVSCFRTFRQAKRVAERWGLGPYVAELSLEVGHGICIAVWGSPGR